MRIELWDFLIRIIKNPEDPNGTEVCTYISYGWFFLERSGARLTAERCSYEKKKKNKNLAGVQILPLMVTTNY
jgi:hypothetical protein